MTQETVTQDSKFKRIHESTGIPSYENASKLKEGLIQSKKFDKVKIVARNTGLFDVVCYVSNETKKALDDDLKKVEKEALKKIRNKPAEKKKGTKRQ